jgi:hypothetical protein
MKPFWDRQPSPVACGIVLALIFAVTLIFVAARDAAFRSDCLDQGYPDYICEKAITG